MFEEFCITGFPLYFRGLEREIDKAFLSHPGLGWLEAPVPPGNSLGNSGQRGRAVAGGKCVNQELMWIS